MSIEQAVTVSFLVETLGQCVRWLRVDAEGQRGWSKERLGALVFGLLLAALTGANMFALLELPLAEYVPGPVGLVAGVVGSGLIFMRGANFLHDILARVQGS